MGSDITLTSTTDSLEQVQDALKIPPEQRVATTEPPAAATPGGPPAPAATEPPAPAAAAPAPAAAAEPPAPAAAAATGDDDELDDATPAAEQTPQQRQRRNRVQQRISELVRERDTARGLTAAMDAELKALRKRVEELASGKPAAAEPAAETPPAAEPKPKPTPDKFANYEDYTEAMAEWKAEQIAEQRVTAAVKAEREKAQQDRENSARQDAGKRYMESVTTAREKYADYDEVVGREDIPISVTMQQGMLTSQLGAEIAYYLGQHPEECQQVFALGDTPQALRAFGRLEARVEAKLEADKKAAETAAAAAPAAPAAGDAGKPAAAPAATTLAAAGGTPPRDASTGRFVSPASVTKAPDPISPVGGGPADTTVPPDQMSYQEYKRYRNQQEMARRGLR